MSNINDLLNALDWFQNSLKVIFPEDKYNEGVKYELQENSKLLMTFQELLKYFDTGIDSICLENVKPEETDIPAKLFEKIKEEVLSPKFKDISAYIVSSDKNSTYFVSKKDEDVTVHRLVSKHHVKGLSESTSFDMSQSLMALIELLILFR
ncbi:MAG: hypothetical protein IPJ37_10870 [Bacteroidales bacterium]|nr:hypothetical protein [Bacteroidales bacterium]